MTAGVEVIRTALERDGDSVIVVVHDSDAVTRLAFPAAALESMFFDVATSDSVRSKVSRRIRLGLSVPRWRARR